MCPPVAPGIPSHVHSVEAEDRQFASTPGANYFHHIPALPPPPPGGLLTNHSSQIPVPPPVYHAAGSFEGAVAASTSSVVDIP